MRRIVFAFGLFMLSWSGAAFAALEIHFYSKDFASTFPHGFVRITGTLDSTGEAIDTNYGFTPVRLTPGVLTGAVKGRIQTVSPRYVSRSVLHFSLKLTEEQYRTVLGVVAKWRDRPQPNYLLNSRNCVHFVADVAATLGLQAPAVPQLMKKPKSFLQRVTRDNSVLIANWNSAFPAPVHAIQDASHQAIAR